MTKTLEIQKLSLLNNSVLEICGEIKTYDFTICNPESGSNPASPTINKVIIKDSYINYL